MEFSEIKKRIFSLLSSPQPAAEDWSDVGVHLEALWADAQREMRAKELTANRKFKEIRHLEGIKSRADAEIEWLASEEYQSFKEAEDTVEEIQRWITRATNESVARRNK
jgi:hypothetical protein